MATNNNAPYSVLVSSGDQGLLAPGGTIDTLAAGQLGVFDADTNLAVNAASTGVRNIYLAAGIEAGKKVRKSVGQRIGVTSNLIEGYTLRCYNPGQDQIIRIEDITNAAKCGTSYGIKIEFRSNTRVYQEVGAAQIAKTFVVKTPCCDDCSTDCPTADPNWIAYALVEEINKNSDNSLATAFLYESSLGIPTYAAIDYDTWVGGGKIHTSGDYLGIQISISPEAAIDFCSIPAQYYKLRGFKMHVSALGDFACGEAAGDILVTITEAQPLLHAEGKGIDLKNLEYGSLAYSGELAPEGYRIGSVNPLPYNVTYQTVVAEDYMQLSLTYRNSINQGGRNYEHTNETVVAIPTGDTTTRDALMAVLDAMLSNSTFGPLADDATACDDSASQTSAKTAETEGVDIA